jgi:hypothetical protein
MRCRHTLHLQDRDACSRFGAFIRGVTAPMVPGPRDGILGSLELMRNPLPSMMKTFAEYGDVVRQRVTFT